MLYTIYEVANSSGTRKFLDNVMGAESAIKRINFLAGKKPYTKFLAVNSDGVLFAETAISLK